MIEYADRILFGTDTNRLIMMKKFKLLSMMFLLTTLIGIFAYSCEEPTTPSVEIDGKFINWESVPDIATAPGYAITNFRVSHDETNIYFLILGSDMGDEKMLYIDADNNITTGYTTSDWENAGFEYLLRNNTLFKLKYNGSNWSWIEIGVESVMRDTSSTKNEIAILRSAFTSLTGKIKIAYSNQTSGSPLGYLPSKNSDAALYVIDSLAITTFEIIANAGVGGVIDPSDSIVVKQGDDITFQISPINDNYTIKYVLVDDRDVGSISSYTFSNAQTDHAISAVFEEKRLITISPYLINYGEGTMDLLFRTMDGVESVIVDWGTSVEYGNNSGQLIS